VTGTLTVNSNPNTRTARHGKLSALFARSIRRWL